ncbi:MULTISPECIES: IclR family transcriptional regulator [unclassified Streptomyces]|uniref:IclR family transcriptional regulator n=1 Tax=unclassified Streptomyces TaxID=2593676 RepID=UPI002E335806|nr:IclR family transcriptional regulator [Streptomyces sp. NBC_01460]WSS25713.1 IclR family transcriptional regulator [Streptomyces sp. NBC_01185]
MTSESLSSVHRALDVLRTLGQGPMGVQEVARTVGREKSQVSRTLKVLAEEGFLERDPGSLRYRIGWQLLALAASAGEDRLHREAPQVLRELVHQVGEPAYLTVLSGHSVVTVLTERTSRTLQAQEWIGRTSPLNCTSAGRALLFGLPDDQVGTLLVTGEGVRLPGTDAAPRDVPALLERLRTERARGYAVAAEEMEPGLIAVAAPVHDHRGDVVAALNVSAPVFRLPPEAVPGVVDAVVTAAHRLSARLNGAGPETA